MRIPKIAAAVVVLAAVASSVSAVTPEEARGVRAARIVAALKAQPEIVAAARAAAMTRDQPDQVRENAVSKVDKNSFVVIGNVFFYDTDFFSDGTPVTVGVADVKKPRTGNLLLMHRQPRRDLPLARPPSARRLAAGRRRGELGRVPPLPHRHQGEEVDANGPWCREAPGASLFTQLVLKSSSQKFSVPVSTAARSRTRASTRR